MKDERSDDSREPTPSVVAWAAPERDVDFDPAAGAPSTRPGSEGAYRTTVAGVMAVVLGLLGLLLTLLGVLGFIVVKEPSIVGSGIVLLLGVVCLAGAYKAQTPRTDSEREQERERLEQRARELRERNAQRKAAAARDAETLRESQKAQADAVATGREFQLAPREPQGGRMSPSGNWLPQAPKGRLFTPSNLPEGSTEIVGETYQGDAIAAFFTGDAGLRTRGGIQTLADVVLARDPRNPFDLNSAVAIWLDGRHVGYIASDEAGIWTEALTPIEKRGLLLTAPARVWARKDSGGGVGARITLMSGQPPRGWKPR